MRILWIFRALIAAVLLLPVACAAPPAPVEAVIPPPRPLPALALIDAETQGYAEGLAAGERIQSRHDRARYLTYEAKVVAAKTAPPPAAVAAAVTSPAKAAAPAPRPAAPAAPQISYVPVGPATPVTLGARAGDCGNGSCD